MWWNSTVALRNIITRHLVLDHLGLSAAISWRLSPKEATPAVTVICLQSSRHLVAQSSNPRKIYTAT